MTKYDFTHLVQNVEGTSKITVIVLEPMQKIDSIFPIRVLQKRTYILVLKEFRNVCTDGAAMIVLVYLSGYCQLFHLPNGLYYRRKIIDYVDCIHRVHLFAFDNILTRICCQSRFQIIIASQGEFNTSLYNKNISRFLSSRLRSCSRLDDNLSCGLASAYVYMETANQLQSIVRLHVSLKIFLEIVIHLIYTRTYILLA